MIRAWAGARPTVGALADTAVMSEAGPDLSGYPTTDDDVYEWLLSDHPWAAAERRRRAEGRYVEETARASRVRQWSEDVDQRGSGAGSALADLLRPSADVAGLRAEVRSAEPDDLAVHRDRETYARERCARSAGALGRASPRPLPGDLRGREGRRDRRGVGERPGERGGGAGDAPARPRLTNPPTRNRSRVCPPRPVGSEHAQRTAGGRARHRAPGGGARGRWRLLLCVRAP